MGVTNTMAKKSGETAARLPAPATEPEQVAVAEAASSMITSGPAAGDQKNQTEDNITMAIKTAEEFVAFTQGNVEAVVKAGQIWATGVQDLSKTFAATAQAQVEETLATVKAITSVKSLKDAVDLQTSLARSSLEKALAESNKLTDASVKLAEQAWAPLTARVTLAMEKFGRAA